MAKSKSQAKREQVQKGSVSSEKAIINSELVLKSLGLENPEVEILEKLGGVAAVEARVKQDDKEFIIGLEALTILE